MQQLKHILSQELPHINATLAQAVTELPPMTRPLAEHVLAAGGKRLRPFLTLTVGRALGCTDDTDLYTLGAAVEMLHAATLVHDDILDNAALRRGKAAAHTVYGVHTAILAGDAMLAKSLLMVSALSDTRMTAAISEAVMRTASGEIAEFAHVRNTEVTHEDYLDVITGKTAWMLRASCELGALRANAAPELLEAAATIGLEMGIAFQMVDDALDFSPAAETGKPKGGDIKEGKITPPLLLYMRSLPDAEHERLKRRFAQGELAQDELALLCADIVEGGWAHTTREMAQTHLDTARTALERFPASAHRDILTKMIGYIQNRQT